MGLFPPDTCQVLVLSQCYSPTHPHDQVILTVRDHAKLYKSLSNIFSLYTQVSLRYSLLSIHWVPGPGVANEMVEPGSGHSISLPEDGGDLEEPQH